MKKHRFKLAWRTYSVGDVIEPTGVLGDWLSSRGYTDVISDTANAPPVADIDDFGGDDGLSEIDKLPPKRKPGRPRKTRNA